MATVKVHQAHALGATGAKAKLADFESLLERYRVKLAWKGDTAAIQGVGVGGDVVVRDDAVDVTVKLGLLAKAAGVDAGRLEASIVKRLKASFED
ncbi:MAG: polyhydroxyalkanoic acid system family protein [Alphaproteobacteria bacterium]|nr:polyhydroxyalkanoic acid system family protein [Alphaproteobacteria bacterium]